MKTHWTDDQQKAIGAPGAVIVTAAAGSGKTAVLVERVIRRLCDPENPIPADRLLIVTFTRAAAAEMRQRIEKRLAEECIKQPENVGLLKQQLLLSSADICTIDSFCIKLIRNYFNGLNLPPDFRIADAATAEQIRGDVIRKLFDERLAAGDEDFLRFVRSTDSVYGDSHAAAAVLRLYDFSSTMPDPEQWLQRAADAYLPERLADSVWVDAVCGWIAADAACLLRSVRDSAALLPENPPLFEKCGESYTGLTGVLERLLENAEEKRWDALYEQLLNPPAAFPRISGKKYDPLLLDRAKACYKRAVGAFKEWQGWIAKPFHAVAAEAAQSGEIIREMIGLCSAFADAYLEELNRRCLLTFAHTEQLALRLLTERAEDGSLRPSALSETVCELYDEIMVDEYQDVNSLQSTLFTVLSSGGKRLFTVGDAKQSIYGFRGANPDHFLRRSREAEFFTPELAPDTLKRVVLSNNFRSRAPICDFINGLFSLTMSADCGGIHYDRNEMLFPLAEFPENGRSAAEFHLLTPGEGLTAAEAEAVYLADYIEEQIQLPAFLRGENGTLRPAGYGDIAVLFRNTTHFYTYVSELKKRGIPVSIGHGDFFKTREIMLVLSLLRVVHSPMNDIAMLSVMLSPIFGFTEEETACLKAEAPNDRLYPSVLRAAGAGNEKCAFLRDRLSFWRGRAACMPMAEFVSFILSDSGYGEIVSAMSDPGRRTGNLSLLQNLADSFTRDVSGDLGAFLRYLDYIADSADLKSQGVRETDSVRLMTIHMSKGLQFPVTVLAGCFSRFSNQDSVGDLAMSEALGIAVNIVDDEKNVKLTTVPKALMNEHITRRQREEELRLLYVAATRAEEKLAFFLCDSHMDTKLKNAAGLLTAGTDSDRGLDAYAVRSAGSFADWLLCYLLLLPCGRPILEEQGLAETAAPDFLRDFGADAAVFQRRVERAEREIADTPDAPEQAADRAVAAELEQILSFRYPFEELRSIETKTSVSRLAKRNADREFCATSRPAFLSAGGLTPRERGTALHKFMQYADFPAAVGNVKAEIERLYEYEYISRAEADAIDPRQVEQFFASDLFGRMLKADRLYREQRFLLEVKAGELYPDLSETAREQSVMIQGAVDCMFTEQGKIILIDFKTDRTKDEQFLLRHYAEQLQIYSVAAEKMFGMPVGECYLYSLYMNRLIPVARSSCSPAGSVGR